MKDFNDSADGFNVLDGIGSFRCHAICEGVKLYYYDFKTDSWDESAFGSLGENVVEINYCSSGRYECVFEQDCYYYLGEGEVAVSRLSDEKRASGFPTGEYRGIGVLIDVNHCDTQFAPLLRQFDADTHELIKKWRRSLPCRILKGTESINRVFQDMYKADADIGYLKLKVTELVLLLGKYQRQSYSQQHFRAQQVEKAKRIKKRLEDNLDQEITLADLAEEYDISESTIKRCFQAMFGESPNQYRKKLRMEYAAKKLKSTDDSIADIAMQVGYLNPSKFSAAFQSVMKDTPSAYRYK